MKFTFGDTTELNILIDYKLYMRVTATSGNRTNEYFYDEIPMQVGVNVDLQDNIITGEIKSMNMNIHERYGQKTQPHDNSLGMTENDYRTFLSDFSQTLNTIKKHYNEVILRTGIPFPYDVPEFYTTMAFYPGTAYFLFETEEEHKRIPSSWRRDDILYLDDMDEESANPYADQYDGYSMSPGYNRSN